MSIEAGDLLVNHRYEGVVYLVCHLADGGPSKWDFQLVKIIDRGNTAPMVCSIAAGTNWHTSDSITEDGFRKIGHLDLSKLRVNTYEKS